MVSSVPHATAFSATVTCISPGRFGSSNWSVYRSCEYGVSSTNFPAKEWLLPVPKFVNDMR